jgi:hypothetical protein
MSTDDSPEVDRNDGVAVRVSALTQRVKAAEAATASEKVRADAAATALAAANTSLEGMGALTEAHATLQAKYDSFAAEAAAKYSTLEGMVSAGFTAADDRELAEFYHGKSGSTSPITEWAATLSADNAPKGLGHLFANQAASVAPVAPVAPVVPGAPKLPDTNAGVVPPVPPNGELSAEQIRNMPDAQYAEYRKTLPGFGRTRR